MLLHEVREEKTRSRLGRAHEKMSGKQNHLGVHRDAIPYRHCSCSRARIMRREVVK
jgi:hypothetical protein